MPVFQMLPHVLKTLLVYQILFALKVPAKVILVGEVKTPWMHDLDAMSKTDEKLRKALGDQALLI
jgi:hypothetical protein